jgi:hypothetical protein
MAGSNGFIARVTEARRRRAARKGDSPEKQAERHEPKRDWAERAIHASPGGQRHSTFKGDRS